MTDRIFTGEMIALLGLEHRERPASHSVGPYPLVYDPEVHTGCFFAPNHDLVALRMLLRRMAKLGFVSNMRCWPAKAGFSPATLASLSVTCVDGFEGNHALTGEDPIDTLVHACYDLLFDLAAHKKQLVAAP